MSEREVTRERLQLEDAIRRVEAEAAQRTPERGRRRTNEPDEQHDPLAELARLIGQTDPFGSLGYAPPLAEASSEVHPSAIHPLHRYAVEEPVEPSGLDDLPSGPPAWVQNARKRNGGVDRREKSDAPPTLPIEVIPEQDFTAAIAFRPSRRGPLELVPDPPKDPHDPEQSQLYLRIRQQVEKLQADIPSQERAQIDDAVNDFLAQPAGWSQIEFKKVLWLCGNALRNIIAQHDAVKDSPEPHYSKLPPAVAEAMRRPVEAWNVFVLGDPDLVNLDAKRIGPQEQQSIVSDIETARPIVQSAAADRNITTEQTANVLDAGLHAASASADNINTRQAQQVIAGTVKNLITQLVRRAYLTCLAIADPKTDEDQALIAEYRRGVARGVGTAAVGAAMAATTFAAPHAASFFEFVVQHAAAIREYFAVASQGPQLVQVIDTIEYVRLKLSSDAQ
jgi:hypothetical protein